MIHDPLGRAGAGEGQGLPQTAVRAAVRPPQGLPGSLRCGRRWGRPGAPPDRSVEADSSPALLWGAALSLGPLLLPPGWHRAVCKASAWPWGPALPSGPPLAQPCWCPSWEGGQLVITGHQGGGGQSRGLLGPGARAQGVHGAPVAPPPTPQPQGHGRKQEMPATGAVWGRQ